MFLAKESFWQGNFFCGIKMFSRMKVPGLRGFPRASKCFLSMSKCYEINFRYKLKEFPDTKFFTLSWKYFHFMQGGPRIGILNQGLGGPRQLKKFYWKSSKLEFECPVAAFGRCNYWVSYIWRLCHHILGVLVAISLILLCRTSQKQYGSIWIYKCEKTQCRGKYYYKNDTWLKKSDML